MSVPADPPGDDPGNPTPPPRRGGGLQAVTGEQFSLNDAIGGPRGVVEALLPSLVFLVTFTVTHQLRPALIWAVAAAVVLVAARAVTRSSPMQAISGLVGVAFCAWFANRSGQARDYYVPGFWINTAYATGYALTLIPLPAFTIGGVKRSAGSYPVMGLLIGMLTGEGLAWRDDAPRRRMYTQLTLLWIAFYLVRLVVQVPLYLADNVKALGTARLVMGTPLFAFVVWLTWLVVRARPKPQSSAPAE